MTLVLTDVTPWGIVMGADSALTVTQGGEKFVRTGIHKLRPIDRLGAGISFWGLAQVEGRQMDLWLQDFANTPAANLEECSNLLCERLRGTVGVASELMGFHLASYSQMNGQSSPQVFHIHNARPDYPEDLTPVDFHVEPSLTPSDWSSWVERSRGTDRVPQWELRNGDWDFYARWITLMEQLLEADFRQSGIQLPYPDISAQEEYVRFKIKTIADLYRMSDSPQYVAEPIDTLIISPTALHMIYARR